MIHILRTIVTALAVICAIGNASATEGQLKPQITGFHSNERITHLAPGGANAAREVEVSVALFDGAGRAVALPGVPFTVEAYDGNSLNGAPMVGRATTVSNGLGQGRVRLPLGTCRGTGIAGPVRVHRTSNRPEYWDITYVPSAQIRVAAAGRFETASFVHVCREVYRGTRP